MTAELVIPTNWKRVRLGDLADIKTGAKNNQDKSPDGKYPFFVRSDTILKINSYSHDGEAVLVPGEGRVGEIFHYINGKFDVHQRVYKISNFTDELSGRYLHYYLQQFFAKQASSNAVKATVDSLRLPMFQNFEILLPPKEQQIRIISILDNLDQVIAATKVIIEKNNKLKKALLRDLFANGIAHDEYKESELGRIPSTWSVRKLQEIASVERGKFSQRPRNDPAFYGGDIPFIQTGDVVASKGKITRYSQTLNEKGLSVSRMFPAGTIVMTIAANIGATAILDFDSCFPDSLVGINSKDNVINNEYLEYYLRTRVEYLNSIATQSAQKNINLEKLKPMLVLVPPIDEQVRITKILQGIDSKILINTHLVLENEKLKRGLMHDLLTGKVQV